MLDTCCKERLVVLRTKVHQWAVQKNTGKGTLVASLSGEAGGGGGVGVGGMGGGESLSTLIWLLRRLSAD